MGDLFERCVRGDGADGDLYLTMLLDLQPGDLEQHAAKQRGEPVAGLCGAEAGFGADRARRVLGAAGKWFVVQAAAALICKHARFLNLHAGRTPLEAASRVTAAAHALATCAAAARLVPDKRSLLSSPGEAARRIGLRPNSRAEEALIELSLGYFAYDLCYMLAYERDPLFLAHHAVTLVVWPGCLRAGRGSELVMIGLLLGESTGPLLNAWWLAKRGGHARLARPLSRVFTAAFLLMRLGALPALNAHFARNAFGGAYDERLGRARARLWGVLVSGAVLGGFVWARALIRGLLAELRAGRARLR